MDTPLISRLRGKEYSSRVSWKKWNKSAGRYFCTYVCVTIVSDISITGKLPVVNNTTCCLYFVYPRSLSVLTADAERAVQRTTTNDETENESVFLWNKTDSFSGTVSDVLGILYSSQFFVK